MSAAPRPPLAPSAPAPVKTAALAGAVPSTPPPVAVDEGLIALMAVNELIAALAKRAKDAKAKRRDERYDLNQEVVLASRNASGQLQPLCLTWGLNISNSGLGLLVMQGLLPGRHLIADMSTAVGRSCRIPVRIVHCAPLTQGMHRIGAEFAVD
jgi:hypothetical protein